MNDIREYLRDYILHEFLPGESRENLTDDLPLRTSGILDSIKLLQLIGHLEERYGIAFEAHEAGNVAHFDTIDAMANLVAQKKGYAI
jgi:acyl carrier protein